MGRLWTRVQLQHSGSIRLAGWLAKSGVPANRHAQIVSESVSIDSAPPPSTAPRWCAHAHGPSGNDPRLRFPNDAFEHTCAS